MKQLTLFIENRLGRLETVTEILSEHNINIVCMSLADTTDYGMLRMIVSNPAVACEVFKEKGFSVMLTDVTAVKLPDHFGTLNKLVSMISSNSIDIRYMYALSSGKDAAVVIKTDEFEKTESIIASESEFEILPAVEVYNM